MKLAEILPHLLYEFPHESDLLKATQEISRKFTTDREKISDYLRDERLVSAYTAFYLLTNVPKLKAVMEWMPEEWKNDLRGLPLVDIGAGPGTMSLAWKELFGGREFLQIETSPVMQRQARKLWEGLHPGTEFRTSGTFEKPVLLFGHSANEMGTEAAMNYIGKYSPEHILFIEPGTKEFFQTMLKIRKSLLEEGYHVLYPCAGETECPLKGSQDWCHQFVHVSHDPDVERLSQLLRLDRKLLPLTVQAYSRKIYPWASERLVRVLPETKFSFEWQVCHDNRLEDYQVMKRGMEKSREKAIGNLLAGVEVKTELDKDVAGKKRVKLRSP